MSDWRSYLAWTMAVVLALCGPLLPLLSVPGGKGDLVLVVVPPWQDGARVIAVAEGRPIGPVRGRLGQLATAEGADFALRLRSAGAWLVLDGQAVSTLCGWEVT